jgi:hypothetical protein
MFQILLLIIKNEIPSLLNEISPSEPEVNLLNLRAVL